MISPNYTAEAHVTLVCGKQRSGKTSFVYKYLVNILPEVAAVFIFDKSGQSAMRLGQPHAGVIEEIESAKSSKLVCFNPHRMFPGKKYPLAFPWFCDRVMEWSATGPGRKILFVDELWGEVTPHNVPDELLNVVKTGHFWGLEFIACTHRPREFPIALRSSVTEWVLFHTAEAVELDEVEPYFPEAHLAASLPIKGRFVAFNVGSGGILQGGFAEVKGGWSEFPLDGLSA